MNPARPRVLVIDDGQTYADTVASAMPEFVLVDPGVAETPGRLGDGPAALAWLDRHAARVDVVLLDLHFDVAPERLLPLDAGASPRRTKRFQGVAILRALRKRWPELPVVLLTALEDLSLADAAHDVSAQSMTYFLGAGDVDTLRIRINAALQEAALGLEETGILWGRDPAMRALRRRLAVLARGALPIVLQGESGTGKSHLARLFVHGNSGRRGPFVALDIATLPPDLVPAALFGALRGSYTGAIADRKGAFEAAHKGTLFLDEIQNIGPDVQKQLLRVLQEGRVQPIGATREVAIDVKVVVASNVALGEAVAAGKFRGDLYMRLSPATAVEVPPLRARVGDLAFFVRRLTEQAVLRPEISGWRDTVARAVGLPQDVAMVMVMGADLRAKSNATRLELALPPAAWQAIQAHGWPGNMRELAMVVENLVSFTLFAAVDAVRAGMTLEVRRLQVDVGLVRDLLGHVQPSLRTTQSREAAADPSGTFAVQVQPGATLHAAMAAVERQIYQELYRTLNGDFAQMASRLLGDAARARAVRLRFNQLGLRVRDQAGTGDDDTGNLP